MYMCGSQHLSHNIWAHMLYDTIVIRNFAPTIGRSKG